jgi:hypothetical protein
MVHKNSNAKVTVWHRGFKYTLTNGYTLSVAFGAGNYCDNQNKPLFEDETWYESSDFEVAVFEPNDEIVDLIPAAEGEDRWSDQVIGFVPAAALPMLISALKFWDVRPKLPGDVAAARRRAVEDFEKTLRARCRMFHNICKDYQEKVDKEARASV